MEFKSVVVGIPLYFVCKLIYNYANVAIIAKGVQNGIEGIKEKIVSRETKKTKGGNDETDKAVG